MPAGLPFVLHLEPGAIDAQGRVDHTRVLLPLQVPAAEDGTWAAVEGQVQWQAEIVHHRAEAPLTSGCSQQPTVLPTGVAQQQAGALLCLVQG
ncbi:hypothetical protein D3C77_312700 [compost metagenome]